ncbi:uncharacterized protein BDZ99DRAFT_527865, partial [Mytilinidion resinicola]
EHSNWLPQYWKHKILAVVRILLVTGLYIATGLLLANQNVAQIPRWPTNVPKRNETDSLLVLNAACFQSDTAGVLKQTLDESFKDSNSFFDKTLLNSTPNNKIVGWNFFILMVLWYGFAIIAEAFRLWYHRRSRAADHQRAQRKGPAKWVYYLFWLYQFGGAVFCTVAIIYSFVYIRNLRSWMGHSGWIEKEDGKNPESVAYSFGQLVPIFLTLLTVFTFCQLIGDKFSERRRRGGSNDTETGQHTAPTQTESPSLQYSPLPEKKDNYTVTVASAPITPTLQIDEPQLYPSPTLQQRSPMRPSNLSSSSVTASNPSSSPLLSSTGNPPAPQNDTLGR